MDAARWLDEVFRPALDGERLLRPEVEWELRGGIRALADCGLLDATSAANAEQRLELAKRAAFDRRRSRVAPPGTSAPPPRSDLRAVIGLGVPIADVAEVTLVLVSVELWTTSVQVRLAGLPSAVTHARDAAFEAALRDRPVPGRAGRSDPGFPAPPRRALSAAPVLLADDAGTAYTARTGSAQGSKGVWRLERTFEPAVPPEATRLHVATTDEDAQEVGAVEVDLPGGG